MLGQRVLAYSFRTLSSCSRSSTGMMRSFSALLLLASSHPSRAAFLSQRQCSKRMLHSPFTRALKASQQTDESETATRNFITNLIEDDIKENKVWYSISLLTSSSKEDFSLWHHPRISHPNEISFSTSVAITEDPIVKRDSFHNMCDELNL